MYEDIDNDHLLEVTDRAPARRRLPLVAMANDHEYGAVPNEGLDCDHLLAIDFSDPNPVSSSIIKTITLIGEFKDADDVTSRIGELRRHARSLSNLLSLFSLAD